MVVLRRLKVCGGVFTALNLKTVTVNAVAVFFCALQTHRVGIKHFAWFARIVIFDTGSVLPVVAVDNLPCLAVADYAVSSTVVWFSRQETYIYGTLSAVSFKHRSNILIFKTFHLHLNFSLRKSLKRIYLKSSVRFLFISAYICGKKAKYSYNFLKY